jgi:hypothetical protein
MQELFTPQQIEGLEAVARKNENLVGGLIVSQPIKFLGRKLTVASGLAGAAYGNIPGFIAGVALSKVARAIAEKPKDMQVALSRAFQSPEAAALLHARANPRNLRLARDYFSNLGKSAIMGKAADALDGDDNEDIQMGDEIISEKKTEQIKPAPDVDLDTRKKIEAEIDADPFFALSYELESSRGKFLKNPKSSASGPFQMIDATAKAVGVNAKDNDFTDDLEGMKKLKAEYLRQGVPNDPIHLYANHYLGNPTYRAWTSGAELSEKQQKQVNDFKTILIPRARKFLSKYDQVKI